MTEDRTGKRVSRDVVANQHKPPMQAWSRAGETGRGIRSCAPAAEAVKRDAVLSSALQPQEVLPQRQEQSRTAAGTLRAEQSFAGRSTRDLHTLQHLPAPPLQCYSYCTSAVLVLKYGTVLGPSVLGLLRFFQNQLLVFEMSLYHSQEH